MEADLTGFQTLKVISQAHLFNEWMYQTIRPYLKGEILEIGSGIGNISKYAVRDRLLITLSDYEPAYCQYLKEHYGHAPTVREITSIDLQHTSFVEVYKTFHQRFDTVFLLNVIEHLQDDHKALEYCQYLLKPNGYLVVLAPAYQNLYCKMDKELGHYRRYTLSQMKQLLRRKNMVIVHQQYFNLLGIIGWFFFGKVKGQPAIKSTEMNTYNKLVPLAKFLDKLFRQKAGLSAISVAKKL